MSVVAVDQVETTRLVVKETGNKVNLRNSAHARTNHYIKQSRPYFPNKKLPTYIEFPYIISLSAILWFGSLYGGYSIIATTGVPKQLPIGGLVVCVIFCFIYFQHEWVNQKSLPIVLKQPVFERQRMLNTFYEVTITELKGLALENYRSGIGFVRMTQGKIKFQAFNKKATKEMSRASCMSRVMLFFFLLSFGWNLYFVVTNYWDSDTQ